jgi:2-methylisocitrate lyase-like PEP mutase family enzyme
VAIYPATAFLAATGAVRRALSELRARGRVQDARADMLSLQDYHALLRFHDYAEAEQRYAPATSGTREAQAHG